MQSADPDVPQRPNKCHQETKTLPLPPAFASHLAAGPRRPVPLGARAPCDPSTSSPPPLPLKKGQPYFSDVIGTKARASACGGLRSRDSQSAMQRRATELAGFTRAVTKHLLSAVPRSRLPRARLPFVWCCLFFHHLFSSLFPTLLLRLRRCCCFFFFGRAGVSFVLVSRALAASIWKLVSLFERPTFRPRLFIPSYRVYSPRDAIDTYYRYVVHHDFSRGESDSLNVASKKVRETCIVFICTNFVSVRNVWPIPFHLILTEILLHSPI